jgi:hypothetical protein
MPRGGKRDNSGRPKGAVAKIDQEARDKAEQLGIKPLDVMLEMIKVELCSEVPGKLFLLELCKAAAP